MIKKNIVVEHMKPRKRMMSRVWWLYDQIPPGRRKEAQRLIDAWHYGKISYRRLLQELRRLTRCPTRGLEHWGKPRRHCR